MRRKLFLLVCLAGFSSPGMSMARYVQGEDAPGAAVRWSAEVRKVAEVMAAHYVLPEVGTQIEAGLMARLQRGEYRGSEDLFRLARRLTEDVREESGDLHLRVEPLWPPNDPRRLNDDEMDPEAEARALRMLRFRNYDVPKVEVLPGNVGYLQLNGHVDPDHASRTVTAALEFLGSSDALILDLRKNGGGYERINMLICSYLFEEETKLLTMRSRDEKETVQFWSHPVSGPKLTDVPVFLLLSERSFSAAESLAFMLQGHGRATVVGERTSGGGNGPDYFHLPEIGLTLSISVHEFMDPNREPYYEGVGIVPDIETTAARALDTAWLAALDGFLAAETDENMRFIYGFHRFRVRGRLDPEPLDDASIEEYVGTYATRDGLAHDSNRRRGRTTGPDREPMPQDDHDSVGTRPVRTVRRDGRGEPLPDEGRGRRSGPRGAQHDPAWVPPGVLVPPEGFLGAMRACRELGTVERGPPGAVRCSAPTARRRSATRRRSEPPTGRRPRRLLPNVRWGPVWSRESSTRSSSPSRPANVPCPRS